MPLHLKQQLEKYQQAKLIRYREITDKNHAMVNFSSNDYLAITDHPAVKRAFITAVNQFGLGSGGSPQTSGYTTLHQQLEETFAEHLKRDRALLFNSGYHANLGVITTLATRNSMMIADKQCHASIIDAIILSRANHKRYIHNDTKHAALLLKKHQPSLLITESVFSIHGNIADIKTLASIAKDNHSFLVVDDAHGAGIIGEQGGGVCEHFNLSQQRLPCLITPLGKAYGSMGAIVTGNHQLIEALLQFSRTHRYSTALPPAICAGTLAVLQVMQAESWRLQQLRERIHFFIRSANERALTLSSYDLTPIKSIIMPSPGIAFNIQQKLKQQGILVACIRPPTTFKHLAVLRISLCCSHTEAQITRLLDLLWQHQQECISC